MEKVKFEPKRIIHIDNSIKKIEDVRMFADAAGIDVAAVVDLPPTRPMQRLAHRDPWRLDMKFSFVREQ